MMKFNKLLLTTVLAVSTVSFASANSLFNGSVISYSIGTPIYTSNPIVTYSDADGGSIYEKSLINSLNFGLDFNYPVLKNLYLAPETSLTYGEIYQLKYFKLGAGIGLKYVNLQLEDDGDNFSGFSFNASVGKSYYKTNDFSATTPYVKAGIGYHLNKLELNTSYINSKINKKEGKTSIDANFNSILFSIGYRFEL